MTNYAFHRPVSGCDHAGVVVWITGQPSAGKSTLAGALQRALARRRVPSCVLDGDDVRSAIVPSHGYDDEGRAAFYETLARLATLVAAQGLVAIVPATAHLRVFRDVARRFAPHFVEVFLDSLPSDCARRDAKGLYAAAASGCVRGLPGVDIPYEPPEAPDVTSAAGGFDQVAVERVVRLIVELDGQPMAGASPAR